MNISMNQGITDDGKKFGYVSGDGGGYFFTWHKGLQATLDSLEVDDVDGDGGLGLDEVREFLKGKIEAKYND